MVMAFPRIIATVIIVMETGTQIYNVIGLAVVSLRTIVIFKRSMIDEVNIVQNMIFFWNIVVVKTIGRGYIIIILIMEGEQVVTGKIYRDTHEISVK